MRTFKQFITETALDNILFEEAFERKKALELLMSLNFQIGKHFLKCFLMPDNEAYDHWKIELKNWIIKIDNIFIKPDNKKLRYEDYYSELFDGFFGHVNALNNILPVIEIEYGTKFNVANEKIREKMDVMYQVLCKDLSNFRLKDISFYINLMK